MARAAIASIARRSGNQASSGKNSARQGTIREGMTLNQAQLFFARAPLSKRSYCVTHNRRRTDLQSTRINKYKLRKVHSERC